MHMNWAKAANAAGQDISRYLINDAEQQNRNARQIERDTNREALAKQARLEERQMMIDEKKAAEAQALDDDILTLSATYGEAEFLKNPTPQRYEFLTGKPPGEEAVKSGLLTEGT